MKLIKINKSQKNRLFEAYQDGFSFENLSMIADDGFANNEDNSVLQMRYCTKWLGYPTSMGSSRAVYTLSDNLVLKLAYGNKYMAGIDQNKVEYDIYQKIDTPLLPRIFKCDKNYTYLVSEHVLPAAFEDFEKILGIPFYCHFQQNSRKITDCSKKHHSDKKVGYNKYFDNLKDYNEETVNNISFCNIMYYLEAKYLDFGISRNPIYEDIISQHKWFTDFIDLIKKVEIRDLSSIGNFGIVNRDGNLALVILDSGFNQNIFFKHYT